MKNTIQEIDIADSWVRIVWGNGSDTKLDTTFLRKSCPCAECTDGLFKEKIKNPEYLASVRLEGFKRIGNYAIQFIWSDEHVDGFYKIDDLEQFCTNLTENSDKN